MSAHEPRGGLRGNVPFELLPTNLAGAFTSPAPPPGFDPLSASPAALAAHGIFWRRPGRDDAPRVREAWEHMARRHRRPEDRILPHLEPHPGISHRLRGGRQRDDGTYTSDNWSGATLRAPRGQRWLGAAGSWTVPGVSGSPGARAGYNTSAWVGLDGVDGTVDVLQAGVEQRVDGHGNVTCCAWCEWFAPEQTASPPYIWQTDIPNFAVAAGDIVYCSAQYLATRAGHLFFANETSGQHFSITLRPPPGASFHGEAADWIVDAIELGDPASLPNLSPVHFGHAVCYGPGIASGDPADADDWVIQVFGITLTQVTVAPGAVAVAFGAAAP